MKLETDFLVALDRHQAAAESRQGSPQAQLPAEGSDVPHHLAQILTRLSTHLGVCEHLLSSCAISDEAQRRFRSSLEQANLEVEMAGTTIRRELQNRHTRAQLRAKSHAGSILRDILHALARRALDAQVHIEFIETDLALTTRNESELRYLIAGLLGTVLNSVQSSQRDDKRLTISLERENRSCILKVVSNGPVCAVCSTQGWDETQTFIQALSRNGFGEYLKFLAALQATFRVCSHDQETWLLLRLESLDEQMG